MAVRFYNEFFRRPKLEFDGRSNYERTQNLGREAKRVITVNLKEDLPKMGDGGLMESALEATISLRL